MRHGSNKRRSVGRSLLLLAGVAIFGAFAAILWLAYADVIGFGASGPPPLIKAEIGPIKRVPDDPGGMAVAESSPAAAVLEEQREPFRRERILPRQEVPVALPEPDPEPAPPPPPMPDTPAAPPPVVEALIAPEPEPSQPPAAPPALIAPLAAREPRPAPLAAEPAPSAPIPIPGPAPRQPQREVATAPVAEPRRPATDSGAAQPRSAPAAGATFRIQLGAFRSENAASQAWTDLQRRNRTVLGELRPNISAAETSSGTFFRLQAGSLRSRDAAVQTCAELKAAGNDCFVVGPLP